MADATPEKYCVCADGPTPATRPLPPQACAQCVTWMHSPNVSGYSNTGPTADKIGADRRYPRTARAALELIAEGYMIHDQAGNWVELLAVTQVNGTLLCGRHANDQATPAPTTRRHGIHGY